jgi:hypothetical protein
LDKEYYRSALNLIQAKKQIDRIWLFSNEPEKAIEFVPTDYILRTEVVPDFGGSAGETLEAMRNANSYVIGNSTLGWWGAFLSYDESKVVVAPTPWSKFSPEPNMLIPPTWIRLAGWPSNQGSFGQ